MIRYALCLLVLLAAGCQTCKTPTFVRKPDSADVWNTNYLIDADPTTVTVADLHAKAVVLDQHYWDYAQVDGVIWQPVRTDPNLANPDRYGRGGDSGIFTGTALAAFCFEYKVTQSNAALQHVRDTLRGLYILTHATGTPGVVQRNAFPASMAVQFGYPQEWLGRDPEFIGTGPALADPYGGPQIPPHTYYTRGTKDQLTGMVLGLAAVWGVMDPQMGPPSHILKIMEVRSLAKQIAEALYIHLQAHNWRIRNQNGKNDTNADYVDNLLRAGVLALMVHMGNTALQADYDKEFDDFIDLSNTLAYADRFANFSQYYAHNLRTSRALSLWLLEGPGTPKRQAIATYVSKNLWRFVRGHKNAWFAFVRAATSPSDSVAVTEGIDSLKSLSLKPIRMWASPYHGQEQKPNLIASLICHRRYILDPHLRKPVDYTTWQKEPWDVGGGTDWDKQGRFDVSGLDYLLAYWLGRYLGVI